MNTKAELRNAGEFTLAGAGGIESYDRSVLRNLSGGTLHATGQVTLTHYFGGNQLINEGTMTIGTSPGRMIVDYPFIQASSGRLVVGVAGVSPTNPDFDILQGLSGADALADADRDGDGTINLIEYALNMNAGAADVPPMASGLESISGEHWLVLHYRRWADRVSAGLSYVPEGSATLADWSGLSVIDEPDPAAAVVPGSEVRRSRVMIGEIRKFLRLRVE